MIVQLRTPLWACISCGMYSTRRYNVERHVSRMHSGYSSVIPFTEYILGRCRGFVTPPYWVSKSRPSFNTSEKRDTPKDEIMVEQIRSCTQLYCSKQQISAMPTYLSNPSQQPIYQQSPPEPKASSLADLAADKELTKRAVEAFLEKRKQSRY